MVSCRWRAVLVTLLYWALWAGSAGARSLIEESNLKRSLPQLYHTPEVFLLNYKEMSENLKVFIYPNSQNASYEYDVTRGGAAAAAKGAGSEVRFLNALTRKEEDNSFVTNSPEEAHLFFLPVSSDAMVSKLGPKGVGNHLRDYVQFVRDSFPFWNRALGSDHFYLATQAYELLNERNNVEFSKNAIQVACSPLPPLQFFFPHKDIALPSYSDDDLAPSTTSLRTRLAHVGLETISAPYKWKSDADFGATSLKEARFFVTDSMRSVVDALRAGCVPVLVLDTLLYDLPFQDILNWREFALVTGAAEMAHLKTVLTGMPAGEYERMQYLGLQASKHMQWNDPPAEYDAFHMTLFQLWMRRHSVKYARRSDS